MVPAIPTASPVAVVSRLKKRSEFLKVAATRRKWVTPGLILQERIREYPGDTGGKEAVAAGSNAVGTVGVDTDGINGAIPAIRIGFTVSKKVGNAVARNRARRRLRAVAEQIVCIHGKPGRDYVLIGRRETVDRPFDALIGDLETALQRIGRPKKGGRQKAEGKHLGMAKGNGKGER